MFHYVVARNPFRPGTATQPPYLAGRRELILNAERVFASHGNNFGSFAAMYGARGLGKTVILTEIARLARGRDWAVVHLEAQRGGPFLRTLLEQLQAVQGLSKRVGGSVARARTAWSEQEQELDLKVYRRTARRAARELPITETFADAVVDVVRHRTDRANGLLIAIDEVQNVDPAELSPIGPAVQRISADADMSASVMLAGLSSLPAHLEQAFTYSERWQYFELANLAANETASALAVPADDTAKSFDAAALAAAVEWSRGYPFAVQLIGYHAWELAEDRIDLAHVNAAVVAATEDLEQGLYRRRWDSAPDSDRAYLAAAARSKGRPISSGAIAATLGRSITDLSRVRQRLIHSGALVAVGQGLLDEAIPGLLDYVARQPDAEDALRQAVASSNRPPPTLRQPKPHQGFER